MLENTSKVTSRSHPNSEQRSQLPGMAGFPGTAPESDGLGLLPLPDGWGQRWWEEEPPLFGAFLTMELLTLENTSKIESNL